MLGSALPEGRRKSFAIWYMIFRQSPKLGTRSVHPSHPFIEINMTTTNDWKTRLATLALGTSLIASAASADAATGTADGNPFDGNWHFTLTPYVWLPNVNGTADVRLPGVFDRLSGAVEELRLDAEVGPNDYLEHLQFALMLTGEARKGRWSVAHRPYLRRLRRPEDPRPQPHGPARAPCRYRQPRTGDEPKHHRLDARRDLHPGICPELARRPPGRLPLSGYGLGPQVASGRQPRDP